MTGRMPWLGAVTAALLLCISPFFGGALLREPLGHVPLFTSSLTLPALGVYGVVLLSALAGVATKAHPALALLFVCALAAAFADARFAIALALAAAPALLRVRTA